MAFTRESAPVIAFARATVEINHFHGTLPGFIRLRPRLYGRSRYGVGAYSSWDATRYAWVRNSLAGDKTQTLVGGKWGY